MLKAAQLINKKINAQYIIAKPNQAERDIYERILKKTHLNVAIVEGKTYECIAAADFCLVCSGTATLETAIMQKPFLLIYKMNLLNYLLYRPQVKLPYIGLANIVVGRKIIPELIQFQASPDKIAKETLSILNDPARLEKMHKDLAEVKTCLGEPGAAIRASHIIIDFLKA